MNRDLTRQSTNGVCANPARTGAELALRDVLLLTGGVWRAGRRLAVSGGRGARPARHGHAPQVGVAVT